MREVLERLDCAPARAVVDVEPQRIELRQITFESRDAPPLLRLAEDCAVDHADQRQDHRADAPAEQLTRLVVQVGQTCGECPGNGEAHAKAVIFAAMKDAAEKDEPPLDGNEGREVG